MSLIFRVHLTLYQHPSYIRGENSRATAIRRHFDMKYFQLYTYFDHNFKYSLFISPSEPAVPGILQFLQIRPWLWTGSWLNRMAWKSSSSRKSSFLLLLLDLLCASLLLPTPSWPGAGSEAASRREGPFLLRSFVSSWPLSLSWETVPELFRLSVKIQVLIQDCPETLLLGSGPSLALVPLLFRSSCQL